MAGLPDPRHASAIAILSVHAVISFCDAVCIRSSGLKSTSPDHNDALGVLRACLGSKLPAGVITAALRVLREKARFEYQGYVATSAEAASLLGKAERFAAWAEGTLEGER